MRCVRSSKPPKALRLPPHPCPSPPCGEGSKPGAGAVCRKRVVIPRSLPPCPPPTRRGRKWLWLRRCFDLSAAAGTGARIPPAHLRPKSRPFGAVGLRNAPAGAAFAPKGVRKVLRRYAAQFFINAARSAATLFPLTPFSEKGVPPQRRGIRARGASLGLPGGEFRNHPGLASLGHPSVGGAREGTITERFQKIATAPVSGPPPRRRGQGGSERRMSERSRGSVSFPITP